MKKLKTVAGIALIAVMAACGGRTEGPQVTKSGLDPRNFAAEFRGDSTALYTLTNASGMEVCITNYGGRIVSLMVPDRNGELKDVVLGFDSVQAYYPENNLTDFGATVGRFANRINQGRFTIDSTEYQLPLNNGPHSLHGGGELGDLGWQYRVFKTVEATDSSLTLSLLSKDGDNGYPGNVNVTVNYLLRADNSLDVSYSATTDKPTIINMTNHSYFNLNGDPTQPVTNNLLMVNASQITPIDPTYLTYGTMTDVKGTPFDFIEARVVGEGIGDTANEQVKNANGIDHNFVLDTKGDISQIAAELQSPSTGIVLDVYTEQPGIQIYSGNFLDGTQTGKSGIAYGRNTGICLEPQHYPDSPNKPQWPSTRLNPGETYKWHSIYRFSVKK